MNTPQLKYEFDDLTSNAGNAGFSSDPERTMRNEVQEETMHQSEHKYRTLFENLSQAAFLVKIPQGTIVDCNPEAEKLLLQPRAEILGKYLSTLHPSSEPQKLSRDFFNRWSAEPRSAHYENEVVTTSGSRISVAISCTGFKLNDQTFMLALFRDLTERNRAAEALRMSEERFRYAARATREAIWEWIPGKENVCFSESFAALFRYADNEVVPTFDWWKERIHSDDRAEVLSSLENAIQNKSEVWTAEYRFLCGDGVFAQILDRAFVVYDSQANTTRMIGAMMDVTEQKNLEAQFLRAQRMESIGTLASGVAHDLNNILAPIMMSAPLLRGEVPLELRNEIVDTVEACAQRGSQIVNQVLAFGRGLKGERHLLQIGSLIKEIVKLIQETFPRNIRVECSVDRNLRLVNGDSTQLHQVLLNLCVNARDAMQHGGLLQIRASNLEVDESCASMLSGAKPGEYVVIEVSDNGTGISPDILDSIFDPFFTTKEVGKGTGLGLSTVHGIVKSHEGSVVVNSELDRGSSFRVYLPSVAEAGTVAHKATPVDAPHGNGELVLVVDDEPAILAAIRVSLQSHGYRVLTANDGAEAIGEFARNPEAFSLLITDIMMPYMDGINLIRAIRRISPGLPIIASSGLCENPRKAELTILGVQAFLEKPYTAAPLLETTFNMLHSTAATMET